MPYHRLKRKAIFSMMLAILLTLSLVITSIPYVRFVTLAEDETASSETNNIEIYPEIPEDAVVIDISTIDELTQAYITIKGDATDTPYLININEDLTGATVDSVSGHELFFNGNHHIVAQSQMNPVVNCVSGGTLNLYNIVIKGSVNYDGTSGVQVTNANAVLHIYSGTVIRDFLSNNNFGGAIEIRYGMVYMHDGIIDNCRITGGSVCYGGGVAVTNGGTFIMDAGTISNCCATTSYNNGWQIPSGAGGGVFVYGGGTFVMNGGTISNCLASSDGGGIAVINSYESVISKNAYGYLDSTFSMTGGSIRDCQSVYVGGGIAVLGTYINFQGLAAANPQPGIIDKPGIFISGGEIENNITQGNGGGIFLNWIRPSIPVQIYDATISGNIADEGGGISVFSYWTTPVINNSSIVNNTAAYGGGIALNTVQTITTVTDTVLANNHATDAAADVYVYDSGIKLNDPMTMGENYLGMPSDLTGLPLEKWYEDNEGNRFEEQDAESRTELSEYTISWVRNNEYMLIAASVPLLSYSLTYNANGGVGETVDQSSPYFSDSVVTVLPNGFSRDGYIFTGWNTASDGDGAAYQPGDTFPITSDTTLYAQWMAFSVGAKVVPGRILNPVDGSSAGNTVTIESDGAATALITVNSGAALYLHSSFALPVGTAITMRCEDVFYYDLIETPTKVIPLSEFKRAGDNSAYTPSGDSQSVQLAFVFPSETTGILYFSVNYTADAVGETAFSIAFTGDTVPFPEGHIELAEQETRGDEFAAKLTVSFDDLAGDASDRRNNCGDDYAYDGVLILQLKKNGEDVPIPHFCTVTIDGQKMDSKTDYISCIISDGTHDLSVAGLSMEEYTLVVGLTAVDHDARYASETPFGVSASATATALQAAP